jgi:hypothetical protein
LQGVLLISRGDDGDFAVVRDEMRGVDQTSVDTTGQRRSGESRTYVGGDLVDTHRLIETALRTIGEGNNRRV